MTATAGPIARQFRHGASAAVLALAGSVTLPTQTMAQAVPSDSNDVFETGPASAEGDDSIAIGTNADANADYSVAVGVGAVAGQQAGDRFSTSVGFEAISGFWSTAVGTYAEATGDTSAAFGYAATAENEYTTAVGPMSTASGLWSAAIAGGWSIGDRSVTMGWGAEADMEGGAALGVGTIAYGRYGLALGTDSISGSDYDLSLGSGADYMNGFAFGALGSNGVAVGWGATTFGRGAVALGYGSFAAEDDVISVGRGADDVYGRAPFTRRIVNVGAGAVSANSTEAVTGGQLHTTNQNVTALGGRMTDAEGGLSTLQTRIADGAIGLVLQDPGTLDVTVGAQSGGARVDFAGSAGARTLTGIAPGGLSAASTDAVSGAQLYATNQTVGALGGDVSALDGRVTASEGDIATLQGRISGGSIGLLQQDSGSLDLTVAAGTGGGKVDFTGTGGARTLTGLRAGAVGVSSNEAVTGAQLHKASAALAAALGGGAALDAQGALIAPTYVVQGASWRDVGGALGALDRQVTTNTSDIGALESSGGGSGGGASQAELDMMRGQIEALTAALDRLEAGAVGGADASGTGATAAGDGAQATQFGDTAYGAGAQATGDPSTAVGYEAIAAGQHTTAIGGNAQATGTLATALGQGAVASGDNAVALGQGASAAHANAVAIGQGVTTARDGQIAIGRDDNTYTMAGLSSSASRAAQSGETYLVTTDAAGNLATMDMAPWVDRMETFEARIGGVEGRMEHELDRHADGVAIALALSGAQMLMPDQQFAVSANLGMFDGHGAVGFGAIGRITRNVAVSAAFGSGFSSGAAAGRSGISIGW